MALLWVDGFEKYGPSGAAINPTDIITWKYLGHFDERIDIITGSTGNAIRLDNTSIFMVTPVLDVTGNVLVCGFAFKFENTITDGQWIVDFRQANMQGQVISYNMLGLQVDTVNSANEVSLVLGGSVIDTSSGTDLQVDTWYYLEFKVMAHNTSGTAEVYLDGSKIIDYSGDTQYIGAFDQYCRVLWRDNNLNYLCLDDLYICDGSGNTNNDILGSCNVYSLSPSADVSGNWTPSTGNDFYAVMDEDTLSSDYISETTSGNQVLVDLSNLPSGGTIAGIMISAETQVSGNLNKYAKLLTQNGSVGSVQTERGLLPGGTNPLCTTHSMDYDSDGNSWTSDTVNSLRIGVELS